MDAGDIALTPELLVPPLELIERAVFDSLRDRSLDDNEPDFWTAPEYGERIDVAALAKQISADGPL